MGHEAGMAADLHVAKVSVQLALGHKGCHRVDDDQLHGSRADKHVRYLQGLLAVVRLGHKELVGIDAQGLGIGHVKGMLGINEGAGAAALLALGNKVQGKRCLARGLGAEDFGHPAARDAADAKGLVKAYGASGNDGDAGHAVV